MVVGVNFIVVVVEFVIFGVYGFCEWYEFFNVCVLIVGNFSVDLEVFKIG